MRYRLAILLLSCLTLCADLALQAQNSARNDDQNSAIPIITFDRVWEAYTPQNVTFTVQSTGTTKYISRNPLKPAENKDADPDYTLDFTMSARNREKIFRDAREADYFHGDFTFKKHPVASTGKKTLTYSDQVRHFDTSFDYSENRAIQEISNIFQGISNTIEHGRKLQYLRRFDKLGLEDELKGMENDAESHNLEELQIVAPMLESIANDPAILNIARQRARRLLAKSRSQ